MSGRTLDFLKEYKPRKFKKVYTLRTNGDLEELLRLEEGITEYPELNSERLNHYIISRCPEELAPEDSDSIMEFSKKFTQEVRKKYGGSFNQSKKQSIYRRHHEWLDSSIKWPKCISVDLKNLQFSKKLSLRTGPPADDIILTDPKPASGAECLENSSEDELALALIAKYAKTNNTDILFIINHLIKHKRSVQTIKDLLD